MLYIQGMSTCAIQEICDLSQHSNAQNAMLRFCKQTINEGDCAPNGGYGAYTGSKYHKSGNKGTYAEGLGDNYVFHGTEKGGGTNGYASRFATFIIENKLGGVFSGNSVTNHRYHTDHVTKAFIWNPDREALLAWWATNKPVTTPQSSVVLAEKKEK